MSKKDRPLVIVVSREKTSRSPVGELVAQTVRPMNLWELIRYKISSALFERRKPPERSDIEFSLGVGVIIDARQYAKLLNCNRHTFSALKQLDEYNSDIRMELIPPPECESPPGIEELIV